jgi:pimeloyl-ACP methyl ester carboxylesterase
MKRSVSLLAVAALIAAACASSTATGSPATVTSPSPGETASAQVIPAGSDPIAAISSAAAGLASPVPSTAAPTTTAASLGPDTTVWLCKPGLAANPCAGSLDATLFDASGAATMEPAAPAANPPIDCFYVYPTVSRQSTINATLAIDPEIKAVAEAQAARFSQVCNVYAPVYPQLTLAALNNPGGITLTASLHAYNRVADAWSAYLAHYNHGRGVVLIGHSQGAFVLSALIKNRIDSDPAVRSLLVSAILLGGNIEVPVGKAVGGTFSNVPACASSTQTGCVIAYSTFDSTPPANAVFGRTNSILNLFSGLPNIPLQVLCVNPAAPSGGSAMLRPYVPTTGLSLLTGEAVPPPAAKTPFVGYTGQYSARCETADGATWLQVDQIGGSGSFRAALPSLNPSWGLHVADVNIALGNLVDLVRSESAVFY